MLNLFQHNPLGREHRKNAQNVILKQVQDDVFLGLE